MFVKGQVNICVLLYICIDINIPFAQADKTRLS